MNLAVLMTKRWGDQLCKGTTAIDIKPSLWHKDNLKPRETIPPNKKSIKAF